MKNVQGTGREENYGIVQYSKVVRQRMEEEEGRSKIRDQKTQKTKEREHIVTYI